MLKKIALASIILLGICHNANAELTVKYWKIIGDELIVSDSESNLEWLSLTITAEKVTKNSLMNVYSRMQDAPEYGFDNDLYGWRIANKAELQGLYSHVYQNNEDGLLERSGDFISMIGGFQGAYCNGESPARDGGSSVKSDCYIASISDANNFLNNPSYNGIWNNYLWSIGENTIEIYIVRDIQSDEASTGPLLNSEMTRQQALDYIQHLSTQLTDPNTKVITHLGF